MMLTGKIKPVSEYTESEISLMYSLMAQFYADTDEQVFLVIFTIRTTALPFIMILTDLWDLPHRR